MNQVQSDLLVYAALQAKLPFNQYIYLYIYLSPLLSGVKQEELIRGVHRGLVGSAAVHLCLRPLVHSTVNHFASNIYNISSRISAPLSSCFWAIKGIIYTRLRGSPADVLRMTKISCLCAVKWSTYFGYRTIPTWEVFTLVCVCTCHLLHFLYNDLWLKDFTLHRWVHKDYGVGGVWGAHANVWSNQNQFFPFTVCSIFPF